MRQKRHDSKKCLLLLLLYTAKIEFQHKKMKFFCCSLIGTKKHKY
ncbi:putative secreted protein [Candidatus Phytoplasma solani]